MFAYNDSSLWHICISQNSVNIAPNKTEEIVLLLAVKKEEEEEEEEISPFYVQQANDKP